ncbi:hypothetical protein ES319_A13G021700v1 [Gossypium barbadense]|uniref:Dof zinc finger protein n=4 Tax=Gossypium TaxID=3633 RepID=A0A2P5WK37_GOSBA|nr:hypothetical protein ES319_A13G021700v1 [Gossypium barbadense]PPR91443.1 hypothetical protein GOBAR_AA29242 [Gossypium barbadense]TYG85020.1 hypothetical protein ES288_A13G019400v1 [Gossypium darwinii]TYH90019.1 hypothetical protein ES332_A13G022600v1 [Gossypium tomentosum]
MVFSFVPLIDPLNWQQPPTHDQQDQAFTKDNHHHIHNPQLPPPPPAGGGVGINRPGSMTERARLANIQKPEKALKCPRCESTHTKFCYFNNYSLSQPRYFCKTCKRYWTRGGALRNVPIGGGCRTNKRSKGSKPTKSPSIGQMNPTPLQFPLLLHPLHYLGDYISVGTRASSNMEFQIGNSSHGDGSMLTNGLVQQFPFLTGLETPTGLYPLGSEGVEASSYGVHHQLRSKPLESWIAQLEAVSDQYWAGGGGGRGGDAWTDLSGDFVYKSFLPPNPVHY